MWWIYKEILSFSGFLETALAIGKAGTPPGPSPSAGGGSITLTNPLGCPDLSCVVNAITTALLQISIPIVAIMVLIGGFQILTAGGDPEKFKTGRKTITYAVVGFAIILVANGVVSIVRNLLKP